MFIDVFSTPSKMVDIQQVFNKYLFHEQIFLNKYMYTQRTLGSSCDKMTTLIICRDFLSSLHVAVSSEF